VKVEKRPDYAVRVVTRDDVLAARETIAGRVHRTPTLTSASLAREVGLPVHLKAELLQRTGSFKPRGVLNKLSALSADEKARGVIGISAGNHAQALAYAAGLEGVDALVVMWEGSSEQKQRATRAYGATVDLEAGDPGAAFDRLHALMEETGRVLVHPFDDPLVIAGQGTVGLELAEDAPAADVVVVPVGGGGLVSGIALAVDARVVAVEPEGSAALRRGLAAGEPVTIAPDSIADGLNAPFAGGNCIEVCREREVESVLVTEDEIEAGFRFLYERAKLACEPAGAAGVAALLAGKVPLEGASEAAVVVSGGNVGAQTAVAILGRL
jgi:threonine dehydratase